VSEGQLEPYPHQAMLAPADSWVHSSGSGAYPRLALSANSGTSALPAVMCVNRVADRRWFVGRLTATPP
jgi:hypothetical protein